MRNLHPFVTPPLPEVPSTEDIATDEPGILISAYYLGSLLITLRDNNYTLLFNSRFKGRADMFTVITAAAAKRYSRGYGQRLYQSVCSHWGMPVQHSLGQRPLALIKPSHGAYKHLGIRNHTTRSYHPNGNGSMERANHAVTKTLAMILNGRHDNSDPQLLHVEIS